MDEKLINTYVNALASQMNDLNLENILLKSKLAIANEKIAEYENAQEAEAPQLSEFVEADVEHNKAKKK